MDYKNKLRTVRFSTEEGSMVDEYLKKNPLFESFSALARIATLAFIGEGQAFHLDPVPKGTGGKRPSFVWDYELSESAVREILGQRGFSDTKRWLIERILSQARFDETIKYLTTKEIRKALPQVRLLQKIRERWEYALNLWSQHG